MYSEQTPWVDTEAPSQPAKSQRNNLSVSNVMTSSQNSSLRIAQSGACSTVRPPRLTPRCLIAHPIRLEAVNDPLGPLGTLDDGTAHINPSAPPSGPGAEIAPAPPRKESLSLRTILQTSSQPPHRKGRMDPYQLDGDNDDDAGWVGGPRMPPPVQAALRSPAQCSLSPSVSIDEASRPIFQITVGDPAKVGDMTSHHIVYAVRTKTTSKAYKLSEFEVKRRYRDFLWLYHTLHANCPGVVVPPPPEKQYTGRFESDFIECRRVALEKMLNKITTHQTLQHDADLKLFLESESFNFDVKHKERRGPHLSESKSVLGTLGINVGGPAKFLEQDDWFHGRKVYLDALENQLKALLRSMETVVEQRKAMAEAAGEFSASLHALATVELSQTLSGPLGALSELQLRIREVFERQAQQDMLTLGIIIDEYIRLIGSVKQAFGQRQKALYTWHTAEFELQKRRQTQEKILRQGRSQNDRVNQLGVEVSEAERRVQQARLLFEDMGRVLRSELDRFEREKVEDFRSAVETFLESAVEAQKELIEKWETFLLQLDTEDDETVFYRPPVRSHSIEPTGYRAIDRARAKLLEDSD